MTMTTASAEVRKNGEWKEKLITREDPGHVHKILGVLCLCSFLWRFSMAGSSSDMGFVTYPHLTLPTIILHWCLTMSSFIFKIPAKRIKSGDRIWPEMRLHAMVFLSRSLALMCVYWYEQAYDIQKPLYAANFVIVILTLLAADVSTWSVGDNRSPSIRGLSDTHPAIKFYFSLIQFAGTAACLLGIRRFSLMFYSAFVLQINPFQMTLRRKNLVSKYFIMFLYGMELAGAIFVGIYEYVIFDPNGMNTFYCLGVITNITVLLRLGPRVPILRRHVQDNKYILWTLMGLLLHQIRPIFDEPLSKETMAICHLLRISMFALGLYKGWIRDWIKGHPAKTVKQV